MLVSSTTRGVARRFGKAARSGVIARVLFMSTAHLSPTQFLRAFEGVSISSILMTVRPDAGDGEGGALVAPFQREGD